MRHWSREDLSRIRAFFIVGAPRCGTTTLGSMLKGHPAVCFAVPKEPHYFSRLPATWSPERVLADYLPTYFRHWDGTPATLGAATSPLDARDLARRRRQRRRELAVAGAPRQHLVARLGAGRSPRRIAGGLKQGQGDGGASVRHGTIHRHVHGPEGREDGLFRHLQDGRHP